MEWSAIIGLLAVIGIVMWLLYFTIKSAIKDAHEEINKKSVKEPF